ncbi:Cilia- and flagella-associated protein 20 [Orchesella cincta]|uniref:Cilia-and flagella-associated protein 20 n=1 Tax=Orchesella cincta TaxID=48709 RepID=A0A1D2MT68_ORCCI|nr:Cilia- and flagella-associated protein 20 [Orchesella cincta]
MSAYTKNRSADYVRSYRIMLNELTRSKILPRATSNPRIYSPSTTVSTVDASIVYFPLFYAGEKGALGIWEKHAGMGSVKRRLDDEDRSFHVLELSNPRSNLGTFICAPKSPMNALHVTLPHMIIAMKNYRRNFAFEVLVMDSNAYRRRFSFATWYNPSSLKKFSFMCQVPLRLEIGWNEIHVNFNDLVKSTYKTTYVETIRVQVYANCKLRQIFFCDDSILNGELPVPSMRDFNNIGLLPLDFGPRTHPDAVEHGPDRVRDLPYVEPALQTAQSRLEVDVKHLQQKRFSEVAKQRLLLQPYKTYFRDLLQEEKLKRKAKAAAEAALKAELITSKLNDESSQSSRTSTADKGDKIPTLADIRDLLQEKPLSYPVSEKDLKPGGSSQAQKTVEESSMPKQHKPAGQTPTTSTNNNN